VALRAPAAGRSINLKNFKLRYRPARNCREPHRPRLQVTMLRLIQMTVDTGSTSFSVLIPAVTLTSISDHKTFSTEAIITHHTGPNSVPVTGVHETYKFIPLSGVASFVFALVEPLLGSAAKASAA
jgi:hypothetical protein